MIESYDGCLAGQGKKNERENTLNFHNHMTHMPFVVVFRKSISFFAISERRTRLMVLAGGKMDLNTGMLASLAVREELTVGDEIYRIFILFTI